MINQRLFDHYGIDTTKDLGIKERCARPFDTVLVDKNGSCYVCECQSWLPQSVGNLQVQTLSEILASPTRQVLQGSVSDGTYRYCNQSQCSYIRNQYIDQTSADQIKNIRLAIDDSCNLRCPSCRKSMIFHKEGTHYKLGIRLADSIIKWLGSQSSCIKVHIGSDGDPFASHVYRYFMENVPDQDTIKYSILTNGLLLKEFHKRVPRVVENLDTVGISIDGASEDTYEKLRLGGKWCKILEALECVASLKKKYGFEFNLHMVVQQDNYHEVESMAELCRRFGANTLYLNRIQDWQTGMDFEKQVFMQDPKFVESINRLHQKYNYLAGAELHVHNNVMPLE